VGSMCVVPHRQHASGAAGGGQRRIVDQFEGKGGGRFDQQHRRPVVERGENVVGRGLGGVEVGLDPPGPEPAVQKPPGGAIEGVGGEHPVSRTKQGQQGNGDGGQSRRDQPGLGGALQIRDGGAQLAGGGQVLDAVDRSQRPVAHGGGVVVEQ